MATRAVSKLEEQLAALMEKMDMQAERAAGEPDQATVGASGRYSSEAAGD